MSVPFLCLVTLFHCFVFDFCFIYCVLCPPFLLFPFVTSLFYLSSALFFFLTAYFPAGVTLWRRMTCRLLWCPEVERMDRMMDLFRSSGTTRAWMNDGQHKQYSRFHDRGSKYAPVIFQRYQDNWSIRTNSELDTLTGRVVRYIKA